jgi:hypothetical protein
VRDSVRDAAEDATLHSLVADDQEIGVAFGGESHEHVGGVALVDAGLALEPVSAQPLLDLIQV